MIAYITLLVVANLIKARTNVPKECENALMFTTEDDE